MAKLVFLVLSYFLALTTATNEETVGQGLRRISEVEIDAHRQLSSFGFSGFSFSWTNLMFQIGVCHKPADTCPQSGDQFCQCPDCCKPLIPPHLHSYCEGVKSTYGSCSGGSSSTSTTGSDNYDKGGKGKSSKSDSSANQQGSSRRSMVWVYLLGSAVVAAGAAGAVALRRSRIATATARSAGYKAEGINDDNGFSRMMAGLGAMAIAAAAFVGLRRVRVKGGSIVTDDDATAGAISRRMGLLKSGGHVDDISMHRPKPSFITVPTAPASGVATTLNHTASGIEAEGPSRPSLYDI